MYGMYLNRSAAQTTQGI